MSRLPVQLNSLEVFAEAGRNQSFRKAAENLSLTTSAVSQAIRKLEDRLNIKLFVRSGNSVRMTEHGTYLLREVEIGFEYLHKGIETLLAKRTPQLSISSPPAVASLIMPVVQELLMMDSSDLQLVSDESPDYLSYRLFDIAVLHGAKAAAQNGLEALGPDVFIPVCRHDVALSLRGGKDLKKVPLLGNETATVGWDDWLQLNNLSASGSKRLRFNRASHIITALLDGVGIGLESLRIMSPYIERGELVCCPIGEGKSIRREFTFLFITDDVARRERALKVAELIRAHCSTNDSGFIGSFKGPAGV